MSPLDTFWDILVIEGLVDPDQAGRARMRQAQSGGALDTSVIETVALDAEQQARVLSCAARALSLPLAPVELIDAPDLEALARLPRRIVERFGVIPSRELDQRPVLIVPALATHLLEELRQFVGKRLPFYVGSEVELWEALNRFAGMPLPKRLQALWTGDCPSAMRSGEMEQCGPVPIPRSTMLRLPPLDEGPALVSDPYRETDDFAAHAPGDPPSTNPGRPSALGMADTADFQRPDKAGSFVRPPHVASVCRDTNDDQTVLMVSDDSYDSPSTGDHPSMSGEFSVPDTVPPAAG